MTDDITINKAMRLIANTKNKNHWKVRNAIREIELLISGYRITMKKMKGTVVAGVCSHKANVLERRLNEAVQTQ